jgi:hypothetical protein
MKLVIGFLLAPLVVPAVYLAGGFLLADNPSLRDLGDNSLGFLIITGPYAYLVALLIGIPGYFFLRSEGWLTLPVLASLGTALGVLTPALIGIGWWTAMMILGAVAGALSASCFWFIAC